MLLGTLQQARTLKITAPGLAKPALAQKPLFHAALSVKPAPALTKMSVDMRTHASRNFFPGSPGPGNGSDDNQPFYHLTPDDLDRIRAQEFHDLMNHHLKMLENQPSKGGAGDPDKPVPHLTCIIAPHLDLGSVLEHFDRSVYLLSSKDMKFFLKLSAEKELLLSNGLGQLTKLSIDDQLAIAKAIVNVVPEFQHRSPLDTQADTDQASREIDPRNHVLLVKQGTNLENLRTYLSATYPLPVANSVWRDFLHCIPQQNQAVSQDLAVNTWPLFDLIARSACQETQNSLAFKQLLPVYQWMRAGQAQGVFNESDVAGCRAQIVEQSTHAFMQSVKRTAYGGELSAEGVALLQEFGVPSLERAILSSLFELPSVKAAFETDVYAGQKSFQQWFNQASPGILRFCDRDQPVSIVNPNDERWHAIGVRNKDLPLVMVNQAVNNKQLVEFLVGLGGKVIQAFGMTEAMSIFGGEVKRMSSDNERVFSLAPVRQRVVAGFMMRLMVQPDVAVAREFYQTLHEKKFPQSVVQLAREQYKNNVRQSFGKLYDEVGKPAFLFTVPKLSDYVEKVIEASVGLNASKLYSSGSSQQQLMPEEVLISHLASIDRKK